MFWVNIWYRVRPKGAATDEVQKNIYYMVLEFRRPDFQASKALVDLPYKGDSPWIERALEKYERH